MSVSLAAARAALRLVPRSSDSVASITRAAAKRGHDAPVPARLRRLADVSFDSVRGFPVVRLTPKATREPQRGPAPHVIYTHGGTYVFPLLLPHWLVIESLIRSSGATVTVPLYGLAPEHTIDDALPLLDDLYDAAIAAADGSGERMFLAGDSAGGGLALAQAIRFRDTGRPAPAAVLLLSPWVDVTVSDPAARELEPVDVSLRADGLIEAGRWWAGDRDPRDPLVSPLFDSLAGLPPVFTYQGGLEILLPDSKTLTRRILAAGGRAELRIAPRGFHDYVAATWTPEAKRALAHIGGVLRGEN